MQELEPYGAVSSHNSGWSRSHKVMRLRQLQLRSYVQQKKHVSKLHQEFCGRIMFTLHPAPISGKKFYAALAAPEPYNIFTWIFDAAPQHLFFLNRSIFNIKFGAGAAFLYGSGCS
jgi:hypothetical protein